MESSWCSRYALRLDADALRPGMVGRLVDVTDMVATGSRLFIAISDAWVLCMPEGEGMHLKGISLGGSNSDVSISRCSSES